MSLFIDYSLGDEQLVEYEQVCDTGLLYRRNLAWMQAHRLIREFPSLHSLSQEEMNIWTQTVLNQHKFPSKMMYSLAHILQGTVESFQEEFWSQISQDQSVSLVSLTTRLDRFFQILESLCDPFSIRIDDSFNEQEIQQVAFQLRSKLRALRKELQLKLANWYRNREIRARNQQLSQLLLEANNISCRMNEIFCKYSAKDASLCQGQCVFGGNCGITVAQRDVQLLMILSKSLKSILQNPLLQLVEAGNILFLEHDLRNTTLFIDKLGKRIAISSKVHLSTPARKDWQRIKQHLDQM